MKIKLEV